MPAWSISVDQSMGLRPWFVRNVLVFENGFEPKKPFLADSGDGCADSTTRVFGALNNEASVLAWPPQRITARGASRAAKACTTVSVIGSQPILRWEPA